MILQDPQEVPALARHQYGCRILQRRLSTEALRGEEVFVSHLTKFIKW